MELFVLIFNAVIPYFSKGKQVHRVCHLQAEDLSNHMLFKPGIKTRGWQLGSEEETKFTYNSKGVF